MESAAALVLWVAALIVFFRFVTGYLKHQKFRKVIRSLGLPNFRGNPGIGNLYQVLGYYGRRSDLPYGVYVLQAIQGLCTTIFKDNGLAFGSIGMIDYVGFYKAKTVEVLLSSSSEIVKPPEYEMAKPWLGNGLLTSGKKTWKKQRRLLTPSFHFRILEQFQPIMSEQADILVEKFRSGLGKDYIHIDTLISNCTFDMISETAFGVKIGAQTKTGSPIVNAVTTVSASIFERMLKPWLWPDALYWITPSGRKFRKNLDIIQNYVRKVIRERKKKLAEEAHIYLENADSRRVKKLAFLDLLLLHNLKNTDDQLSDQQIEDEVHTFNFAGFDTTAISIGWTLYLLGLYPEIQRKVQQEIDEVFSGDSSRLVENEDIKQMEYLERVIKESQRLYPAVPLIGRRLQEDLDVDGVTIPKGSTCVIATHSLHRDPDVYPNPEVFDPDRFLESNRDPFAFVPFSAGPRNCIGQRFAMMEMKTVIASLLRKYTLTSLDPRDKVLIQPKLTSHPTVPLRQKIELRFLS